MESTPQITFSEKMAGEHDNSNCEFVMYVTLNMT